MVAVRGGRGGRRVQIGEETENKIGGDEDGSFLSN